MPLYDFYHPENENRIATIKAPDAEEAKKCFISSANKGFFVSRTFQGVSPEDEPEYLYFDWKSIEAGLPDHEFDFEERPS